MGEKFLSPYKEMGITRRSMFTRKKVRKCKDALEGVGKFYNTKLHKKGRRPDPIRYGRKESR